MSRGESLETRVLPAAVATVSRATLNITGDADASNLSIEQLDGGVKVTALNGTTLRIAGTDVPNGTLTFSGVTALNVRLGDGNDSVSVLGALNLKNVTFNLGDGDNTLDVGAGLSSTGKLTVTGGTGRDVVTMNGVAGKAATINLGHGNDDLTLRGTLFSGAVSINTSSGADVILIDEATAGGAATFTNSLTINTGEDNDSVTLRNAATKKVTINTGDDDDIIDLDTVTAGGLLNIQAGAGADDVSLDAVIQTQTGSNLLNVGTGADDVFIASSSFQGNVSIDLGTGIVNNLSIDDTRFNGTFVLNANGGVGLGGVGDVIDIETNTSLAGDTVFAKTATMKVGAAAELNFGENNVNSDVDFLSNLVITGINPSAKLNVWVPNTLFDGSITLNKVVRTNLVV